MRAFWAYIRVDEELVSQDQIEEIVRQFQKVDHVEEVIPSSPTQEN
jgi:hypothetical protein